MTIAKRMVALCFAVGLAGATVACSKSDESATKTSEKPTTTESSSDNDSGGDSDSGGLGDIPNLGNMEECLGVAAAYSQMLLAPSAALGGGLTEEQMAEYEKSMEELGASVPDDLKDDLEVVTTAYNTYFKEVGSVLKDGDFLSSADDELDRDFPDQTMRVHTVSSSSIPARSAESTDIAADTPPR